MAGQNDFLIFDENKDNMLTQELYQEDADRTDGFQKGVARSNVNNKVLHQTSMMCHAIGELAKDNDFTVSDEGSVDELKSAIGSLFSASDKVSKSGDTMTGDLAIQSSADLVYTETDNTIYKQAGNFYFKDKNGHVCGQLINYFNNYNNLVTSIEARRIVNGQTIRSQIQTYVDKDGNTISTATSSGVVPNSIVTTLAASRAGTGYYKLGNGLIIQWGSAVVPANETDIVVTLPISFQHGYKVTANHAGSGGEPKHTNIMCAINSNSQFTLNNLSANPNKLT